MNRSPAKLAPKLARIYCVTPIVPRAIPHPVNVILTLPHCLKNGPKNLEVAMLSISTDKIRFPHRSFSQNGPNGASMILHVNPVAYIQAIAVQLRTLAALNACNRMRDELLRMLVWAVVIAAI